MNKQSPNEFRRDIEMRQRNLVYPDTLRNEIRGWRSLITSKKPLSIVQVVGLLTMYLSVLGMLMLVGTGVLSAVRKASGTSVRLQVLGAYGTFFALIGTVFLLLFLLLRWRVRKVLAGAHKRPRVAK